MSGKSGWFSLVIDASTLVVSGGKVSVGCGLGTKIGADHLVRVRSVVSWKLGTNKNKWLHAYEMSSVSVISPSMVLRVWLGMNHCVQCICIQKIGVCWLWSAILVLLATYLTICRSVFFLIFHLIMLNDHIYA